MCELSLFIHSLSTISKALSTSARYAVESIGLIVPEYQKNNNKNLAMLTICNQAHETECILRAIDNIKDVISGLSRGGMISTCTDTRYWP